MRYVEYVRKTERARNHHENNKVQQTERSIGAQLCAGDIALQKKQKETNAMTKTGSHGAMEDGRNDIREHPTTSTQRLPKPERIATSKETLSSPTKHEALAVVVPG